MPRPEAYWAMTVASASPAAPRFRPSTNHIASFVFCALVSALVFAFAAPLMGLFTEPGDLETVAEGVRYLRIEGAFYCGIGCLFLLYGSARRTCLTPTTLAACSSSFSIGVSLARAGAKPRVASRRSMTT